MRRELSGLEVELDQPARDVNVLARASTLLRESRLDAKIRYSQDAMERWDNRSSPTLERDIAADLLRLGRQLVLDELR